MRLNSRKVVILLFALSVIVCKTPPVPPEVEEARRQEHDLWRAGALVYSPEEYEIYKQDLRVARDKLIQQKAKIRWFRDYEPVKADFEGILSKGEEILQRIEKRKSEEARRLEGEIEGILARMAVIRKIMLAVNEGEAVRRNLAQVEVSLREAEIQREKENYREASRTMSQALTHLAKAEEEVFSLLERYRDDGHLAKWRKWADETIEDSKKKGHVVFLVDKLDRKLTVFKKGRPIASYEIGLGRYGLSEKLHAGDDATPEGRYKVLKKLSVSLYYKALLIDYPNADDRKRFQAAQKNRLIPGGVGIGGLIEIHGGGKDSLTNGCIAVENDIMDKVFQFAEIGTPVTIVGAYDKENSLLPVLRDL